MYDVHDWAEVHRLHHVEGLSKAAVAARLSMSRSATYLNDGSGTDSRSSRRTGSPPAPRRTRGTRGPTTSCAPSRPTTTPGDDAGTPTRGGPTSSASPGTQSPPSTRGAGEVK
jgi:hypothetical protein